MKKIFAITGICALLAAPAFAQDKKAEEPADAPAPTAAEVDAAAKTINAFVDDQKKVDGYCAIMKDMDTVKEGDDAKAEEMGQKMDTYLKEQGDDVAQAFTVAESVDPETDEGKKIDEALGKLEEKCGS